MRDVYIVSAAQTKYGKMKETMREAAVEASLKAIDDVGLDVERIDGAFIANAFGLVERQGHLGPLVMSALGIGQKPATTIEAACASASSAFREAYVNVAGGFADCMLAVGVEKVSMLDTVTATGYFAYGSDYVYEGACGASFPGLYAVMANAHFKKFGTTEEQLAKVAVKNHRNAAKNPVAHFQKEITVEQVLASMVVAHPLKIFDACPFSDGAAAAIVTTKEIAHELTDTPIRVAGSGRAGTIAALIDRQDMTSIPGTQEAARQAFKQAKVGVGDIDFAEVHDCFTIAELIAMEDIGFAKPGEAAKLVDEGQTTPDGDVPINPSGGLKAKGHPVGATGLGQIVEAVKQLRGEAEAGRQVDGAARALTHNVGATGGSVVVHVFERAR